MSRSCELGEYIWNRHRHTFYRTCMRSNHCTLNLTDWVKLWELRSETSISLIWINCDATDGTMCAKNVLELFVCASTLAGPGPSILRPRRAHFNELRLSIRVNILSWIHHWRFEWDASLFLTTQSLFRFFLPQNMKSNYSHYRHQPIIWIMKHRENAISPRFCSMH